MDAEFFIEREDDYRELSFGCRINNKAVYFYPIMDYENNLIEDISIDSIILHCSSEELEEIKQVLFHYRQSIRAYYEIVREAVSYPYPREVLEPILKFGLTSNEHTKVLAELNQLTHIYLIKDNRTGYIKIGRSKDPFHRLKTLIKQDTLLPQENEFELVGFWEAYEYMEGVLHKRFADKRVRGEWFNLSSEDIEEILKRYQ